MSSEATPLLARGVPVTLRDGKTYRLVFDFEALASLEEQAGSLIDFLELWREAALKGYSSRRLRMIRVGLVAGLAHTGLSQSEISRLVDSRSVRKLNELFDAIDEAVTEGLPKEDPEAEGSDVSPLDEAKASTGTSTTTSPPSPTEEAIASSGA